MRRIIKPQVLKVLPVPVPPGYEHPEPPNDVLMKHEFTIGLIAPKGGNSWYINLQLARQH
jgi:hypothetical protein